MQRRKSKKRDAIYRELCSAKSHPTADYLYSKLKDEIPNLSLGTVYSNLAAFKRDGSAVCVGVVDGKERFDGNVSPHVHFVCRSCGAIADLWDVPIPEAPKMSGVIDYCQLNYFGICENCEGKNIIKGENEQ